MMDKKYERAATWARPRLNCCNIAIAQVTFPDRTKGGANVQTCAIAC